MFFEKEKTPRKKWVVFLLLWHEGHRLTLNIQDIQWASSMWGIWAALCVQHFCKTISVCVCVWVCVMSHCGVSNCPQLAQEIGSECFDLLGILSLCCLPSLLLLFLSCFNFWSSPPPSSFSWFQWKMCWSESEWWGREEGVQRSEKKKKINAPLLFLGSWDSFPLI